MPRAAPLSVPTPATRAPPEKLSPDHARELAVQSWGCSGDPDRAGAALDDLRPRAKQFRNLFAGISQSGPLSMWATARAERLASHAWNRRGSEHARFDVQRALDMASALNLAPRDAASIASTEASLVTLTPAGLLPLPGSLAPTVSPEALRTRFMERRADPSWARRMRHAHGSYFMGDPMLLALLRRIEPENVQQTLNRILLCATLAGGGVQAVLSLGADPMGLTFFKSKSTPTNLLGAILRMSPSYLIGAHVPAGFYPGRDAILEQSAHLALACVAPSNMMRFLTLLAHDSRRPTGWPEAAALSAQRGHLRCARLFLSMGSTPTSAQLALARSSRAPPPLLNLGGYRFTEFNQHAWEELDALAESRLLLAASQPKVHSRPRSARPVPRL